MVESVFAMSRGEGQIVFPGGTEGRTSLLPGQKGDASKSDANQGEEGMCAFQREVGEADLDPSKGFSGVDEADLETVEFPGPVPNADLGTGKIHRLIDHSALDAMHEAGGEGEIS